MKAWPSGVFFCESNGTTIFSISSGPNCFLNNSPSSWLLIPLTNNTLVVGDFPSSFDLLLGVSDAVYLDFWIDLIALIVVSWSLNCAYP